MTFSRFGRPDQLLQDFRYSARMLRRNPGFAAVTIATLALGIGLTTAMFSVVNGVLLKPLPYPAADRLIWIAPRAPSYENSVSRADYLLWRDQAHSFEAFTAYSNEERALLYRGQPSTVQLAFVMGDFWSISGAMPALGRLFTRDERDQVVLSWSLFLRRFGGDPAAIGKSLTIDGRTFAIIGVLPAGFRFVFPPDMYPGDPIPEIEAYIPIGDGHEAPGDPIRETAETGPVPTWIRVVGRLKPDVSFASAQAEMQVIFDRVRQIPNVYSRWPEEKMLFTPLAPRVAGQQRTPLIMLFGAVGFVLLIAGANFANLLMARASTREKEIAIRSALGASRSHLIRHFLVESICLAILGGVAGLLLARWAVGAVVRIGAHALPRLTDVQIDTRVMLFTAAASLATGILFGLMPIMGLRTNRAHETMKIDGTTSSAGAGQVRFRRWLVTMEFALAIVLLSGAALLLKSFWRMNDLPPGFEPTKLLVVNVSLGSPRYFRHWPQQNAYIEQLVSRAGRLPGVEAVGIQCGTLHQGLEQVGDVTREKEKDVFAVRYVSVDFFHAVRVPLIQGRWPSHEEWRDLRDVVLVNQTFARAYASSGNILGKHIRGGVVDAVIVGVVADFKDFQLDSAPEAQVYMSYPMAPGMLNMRVFVRTGNPKLLETTLSQVTSGINPDVPVQVATLAQILSESITIRRFNMYLFEVFAGSALLLALVGIYGVLAYLVKQRTREIGIRMALGAGRHAIVRMVVWQGMKMVIAGMALGMIAAFGLSQLITNMLYETRTADPSTLLSVGAMLTMAAVLACSQPALRAAKTDPIIALRYE